MNRKKNKNTPLKLVPFCVPWRGTSTFYCAGDPPGFNFRNAPPAEIINSLMPYIFAVSGLILLLMIIASGYMLLTSAGNPDSVTKGKKMLTASLTGFILIFAAFWIWQLVAVFFGLGTSFP